MMLAEQVGSLRRTLHRLLSSRLSGKGKRPVLQLNALRVIAQQGVRTQAELAERLVMDAPAVSRLVAGLEEDKFLRRHPGTDRRCVRLEVTAKGAKAFAAMEEALGWLDAEVRRHLSAAELATARKLLRKLEEGLAADHPAG